MNGKDLMIGMNHIDDTFIYEAEMKRPGKKHPSVIKYASIAACLTIVFTAGIAAFTGLNRNTSVIPQDDTHLAADHKKDDAQTTNSTGNTNSDKTLNMSCIIINELKYISDSALRLNLSQYDKVTWTEKDITDYYGKNLMPAYVPQGLSASPYNLTADIYVKKDGTPAYDTIWLSFYHDYYEDGSPKLTDNGAAPKGFTLKASKTGLVSDCCYALSEEEIKASYIGDTPVILGYQSMSYGPYDSVTHDPSGYYVLHTAEFEYDGIHYEIISKQLSLDEVIKIAASVIYGTDQFTIDGTNAEGIYN